MLSSWIAKLLLEIYIHRFIAVDLTVSITLKCQIIERHLIWWRWSDTNRYMDNLEHIFFRVLLVIYLNALIRAKVKYRTKSFIYRRRCVRSRSYVCFVWCMYDASYERVVVDHIHRTWFFVYICYGRFFSLFLSSEKHKRTAEVTEFLKNGVNTKIVTGFAWSVHYLCVLFHRNIETIVIWRVHPKCWMMEIILIRHSKQSIKIVARNSKILSHAPLWIVETPQIHIGFSGDLWTLHSAFYLSTKCKCKYEYGEHVNIRIHDSFFLCSIRMKCIQHAEKHDPFNHNNKSWMHISVKVFGLNCHTLCHSFVQQLQMQQYVWVWERRNWNYVHFTANEEKDSQMFTWHTLQHTVEAMAPVE